MKKNLVLLIFVFAFSGAFTLNTFGQETGNVITCSDFHITKPLRDLVKSDPYIEKDFGGIESGDRKNRTPQTFVYSAADGTIYGNDPTYMQTKMGIRKIDGKATIQNWAGQTASGFRPFDPSGAAGPNHYIQMINSTTFKVYSKTGTVLLTKSLGTLWTPSTPNDGDPIVLYDEYADRWFLSQFGTSGNKIYIAISTSPDPTGSYYTYTFTSPQFPDYLKFSIWENGYYMTSNQNTDKVFCFERSAMLNGSPSARAISANFTTGNVSAFFCPLPADAEGGLPPANTPFPFFAYSDNAWGGGSIDGVRIWHMTVNWGSTPTASIVLNSTLATTAFDASYNSNWNDIIQPGTSQKLDGIGGVPTFRAQWRKWTGYNSLVMNWGVKISSTQRSIFWVELRQDQATNIWSVYQQGFYTPDTHSRWMGSIAMDDNGSIALCYAKSSSTIYPSLCYTGRLASDPLGTMSFAEVIAIAGDKVQTTDNRFGDYSHTALDPDGITFWHTGEYIAGSNNAVKTRIYSFQLPTGTLMAGVSIGITAGSNPTCAGSSVTFTATPTNGGTAPTYQWKVNGINSGTGSTITTTTLTNGQIVTCEMTSNLPGVIGNPATSNAITMVINPIPATPSITLNGTELTSSSANGNQWYLDGTIIPGAINQTYTYTSNGYYTDIVTENGCSSLPSNTILINVGIDELNNTFGLSIFPNPSNGKFTVSFKSNEKSNFKLEISDVTGKKIYSEIINEYKGAFSKQMNLTDFGKGVYTISLINAKNETNKKMVVY